MSATAHLPLAGGRTRRLFLALWPDAAAREALAETYGAAVAACGGRAVPRENLHLTLEFLGNVPDVDGARIGALVAAGLRAVPPVRLDRLDHWPRAETLVAAPSAPPAALLGLQSTLRVALEAAGFRVDARPFRPHVTLARGVAMAPAAGEVPALAVRFPEVALVASDTGGRVSRYAPLERWVLES